MRSDLNPDEIAKILKFPSGGNTYAWTYHKNPKNPETVTVFILKISRLTTKPSKWPLRPAMAQISQAIHPVWSQESSLSAWRNIGSSATHWAHCKDSEQTEWMPKLIWVFAGRTVILLVLSWKNVKWTMWFYYRANDADRIANSVDADETAP